MPKYAMEFRVVEIHAYQVEADSLEDAKMAVYEQNLEPDEVLHEEYELETYEEVEDGNEMLTPAEYLELRRENADWLSGKANIGTEK